MTSINPRKQSFLERLTGTQVLTDDELGAPRFSSSEEETEVYDDGDEYEVVVETEGEYEEELEDEEDEEMEVGLAIDMYESDDELVIQSMIAGVTPDNLSVVITRDRVTIKGHRIPPQGIPEEHYIDQELYWGPFTRTIDLPYEIDTEGAEAVEKYGLLIIRLPKVDTGRMQELKIRSI